MVWLADTILVIHALFVLFVVGGAFYVWLGAALRWGGVRHRRFRQLHLAAIVFVAAQTALGYACPLTVWEDRLRGATGEPEFIARWLQRAIYYDLPGWVFLLAYIGFALAIALTWWRVPPHPPRQR
jgi:polyferredoxin